MHLPVTLILEVFLYSSASKWFDVRVSSCMKAAADLPPASGKLQSVSKR